MQCSSAWLRLLAASISRSGWCRWCHGSQPSTSKAWEDRHGSQPPARGPRSDHQYRLNNIYSDISKGRLQQDTSYIETVTGEVTAILSQSSLDKDVDSTLVLALAKVFRLFGTVRFYERAPELQGFFDSVSEVLVSVRHEEVLRHLLPSFLWSCSKVRYYNSSLMSHVGEFVLDFLPRFSFQDLNMAVYTYACLNHHLPELVSGLQRLLLSSAALRQPAAQYLVWTLVWAAMVFRDYPKDLLSHVLTDEYIEDCLKRDQYLLISLFQLKISLNKECPDLGLGLGYDTPDQEKRFDFCKSGLRGVSDKTFLRAYEDKLRVFSDYKRSVFGSNLHRALRTALGSSDLVQSDPLSLAGYNFDFEVLFDEDGQPIRVPMQWKYRSAGLLLASLGAGKASKPSPVKMKLPEDLLESMRETEKNECVKDPLDEGEDTPLSFDNYNCRLPSINLASDWGAKFRACPRQPVRRVVVEANGYHHYASNCDHLLGSTVLKKRQCEALGWEVIGIDYKLWKTLENGDAQAKYVSSLLLQ